MSSRRWLGAGVVLGLGTAVLCLGSPALARVTASSEYSKAQTFSGALRYVRLDLGYEVLERDPDAAYLIFRYAPPGPAKSQSTGTVEIVESDGKVRFFVQLPRMPEYHERILRDGLLKKLRAEYGTPPRKKPDEKKPEDKKPEETGDAGVENREGSGENTAPDSR